MMERKIDLQPVNPYLGLTLRASDPEGSRTKLHLGCVPCFQRQALQAATMAVRDEAARERILREVMRELLRTDWRARPPEMARRVHRIVRTISGIDDPYEGVKKKYNELALSLYPRLSAMVEKSGNPLLTAVKLAIAGNIVDFGALSQFDLEGTIDEVVSKGFTIDDFEILKKKLQDAKSMVYTADNAGEIVFDKLLIETMLTIRPLEQITFVVKGGPIINDATLKDVHHVGLAKLPGIKLFTISNGDPNTGPQRDSPEFLDMLKETDLNIAKGQGNYEALSEQRNIFFLLMAKCPILADDLGVDIGDVVLKWSGRSEMFPLR